MPADEEWEFVPGTLVDCKWKMFDGERRLVPTGPAFPTPKQKLLQAAIYIGVLIVSGAPLTTSLNWIVPPSPFTATYFGAWAAASGAAYFRWRSIRLVRQTAGPLALSYCALAIIALFA